jgi:hypothetical protein
MQTVHSASWHPLLRDSLAALALPAGEQVQSNGPGSCIACDLLNDFDHAQRVAIGSGLLTEEQLRVLGEIDAVMESMKQLDFECFNNDVLYRPVWQRLRELAVNALLAFGWEDAKLKPFTEIQPGVWKRPPSDGEPDK